jgi:broad specificity phosphatase PhoE
MARLLYLVRHASPEVVPEVPDVEWFLSPHGTEDAWNLAKIARDWGLRAIYSSPETKAFTTAAPMANTTGLAIQTLDGLRELRFPGWIDDQAEFRALVREVLAAPERSAYGAEPAANAAARFAAAVEVMGKGRFPAAAVSHGRVLTSYLASVRRIADAFAYWQSIPMPGWAAIDLDAIPEEPVSPFIGLAG